MNLPVDPPHFSHSRHSYFLRKYTTIGLDGSTNGYLGPFSQSVITITEYLQFLIGTQP